jgi:hypothetical protein
MAILKALIAGAVIAGCLAGPSFAQQSKNKGLPAPIPQEYLDRKRDEAAVDKQYKETLERTKKDAVPTSARDPWQDLRGSDDSKTKR